MSRAEKKGQVHGGVHTWHQPSQPQNLSPSGITSWDIVFDYILSICHFQLLLLLLWQRVGHQSHSQHLWTTLGVWEGRWSVRCTLGGPATGLEVLQRFMEEEASKKKSNFSVKIQFDVVKSLNLLNWAFLLWREQSTSCSTVVCTRGRSRSPVSGLISLMFDSNFSIEFKNKKTWNNKGIKSRV